MKSSIFSVASLFRSHVPEHGDHLGTGGHFYAGTHKSLLLILSYRLYIRPTLSPPVGFSGGEREEMQGYFQVVTAMR
jgi:hypothetical protein